MNTVLLGFFGTQEIVIIVLIVVLLFGAKKIPQLMKGVGTGIKEFKEGIKEGDTTKEDKSSEELK